MIELVAQHRDVCLGCVAADVVPGLHTSMKFVARCARADDHELAANPRGKVTKTISFSTIEKRSIDDDVVPCIENALRKSGQPFVGTLGQLDPEGGRCRLRMPGLARLLLLKAA